MADNKENKAGEQPTQQPARTARHDHPERVKCVIEVGDDRNRNFIFGPTQDYLRGRWLKANLHGPDEIPQEIELLGDVPGMCIELDPRTRKGRIFDALRLPKNAMVLEKVASAHESNWNQKNMGPEKDREFDFRLGRDPDTEIKTWAYYMRRMLDGTVYDRDRKGNVIGGGPQARIVEGSLPTLEEIDEWPGKIRTNLFDPSPIKKKFREAPLEEAAA
jgi:hypothetical protein